MSAWSAHEDVYQKYVGFSGEVKSAAWIVGDFSAETRILRRGRADWQDGRAAREDGKAARGGEEGFQDGR
jgi:hypothetical protein